MVWLFNVTTPRGQHKKFHSPWSGPYTVVKQLSDSTYRIQHIQNRSNRSVVHFDHLKPFTGVVQSSTDPHSHLQHQPSDDQHQLSSSTPSTSQSMEPVLRLLEYGDSDTEDGQQTHSLNSRCYPCRSHHPPSRLSMSLLEIPGTLSIALEPKLTSSC